MAGGLELADSRDTPSAGALDMGGDESMPADLAIKLLRMHGAGLPSGSIDAFAQRANPGSYPTWQEIQGEMRPAMAARESASADTMNRLEHPPIDRSIPYFRAAAGMLQPTRTGSFAESLGGGLGGWAQGLEEMNKQELDFAGKAALHNYTSAKDRVEELEKMQGLGLHAGQINASLELLGRRLETPAEKYARELGANPGTPEYKRLVGIYEYLKGLPADQQIEAKAAIGKNPNVTLEDLSRIAIVNKLQKEVLADSTKMHFSTPTEKDIWVRGEISRRLRAADAEGVSSPNAVQAAPGTAGAPPVRPPGVQPQSAPAQPASPAGGLQRVAAPVPGPGGSPAAPAAGVSPGATNAAPPYAPFLKGQFPQQPAAMNDIEAELYTQRMKDDESSAREYKNKTVIPEAAAAADGKVALDAQAALLRKDPKLTGAGKEGLATIANWLVSMKLATPEMAKDVSDVQSFDSFVKKAMLSEQTRQHGVQTEGDAARILQAVASMSKTPQANHFILRYLTAVSQRTQERAQFFQQYAQVNGGRLAGAQDRWLEYVHENPLVREVPDLNGKKVILFDTDKEYRSYMRDPGHQRPRT